MDATTKALIETIGAADFNVQTAATAGLEVVEAIDQRSGKTFVVRGEDLHAVVVKLAWQVSVDVMDGWPGQDHRGRGSRALGAGN